MSEKWRESVFRKITNANELKYLDEFLLNKVGGAAGVGPRTTRDIAGAGLGLGLRRHSAGAWAGRPSAAWSLKFTLGLVFGAGVPTPLGKPVPHVGCVRGFKSQLCSPSQLPAHAQCVGAGHPQMEVLAWSRSAIGLCLGSEPAERNLLHALFLSCFLMGPAL